MLFKDLNFLIVVIDMDIWENWLFFLVDWSSIGNLRFLQEVMLCVLFYVKQIGYLGVIWC